MTKELETELATEALNLIRTHGGDIVLAFSLGNPELAPVARKVSELMAADSKATKVPR